MLHPQIRELPQSFASACRLKCVNPSLEKVTCLAAFRRPKPLGATPCLNVTAKAADGKISKPSTFKDDSVAMLNEELCFCCLQVVEKSMNDLKLCHSGDSTPQSFSQSSGHYVGILLGLVVFVVDKMEGWLTEDLTPSTSEIFKLRICTRQRTVVSRWVQLTPQTSRLKFMTLMKPNGNSLPSKPVLFHSIQLLAFAFTLKKNFAVRAPCESYTPCRPFPL